MTGTEQRTVTSWPWVVGMLIAVAVVVIAFWQLAGDDPQPMPRVPTVTGAPILTAAGGDPFAWNVTVSPGQDAQLCGHGAIGAQAEDRTGHACSVVVRPDAAGNDLFGSGGSSTNPDGQTLAWGLVDPDVTEVVVELADGTTHIATVAVGGDRRDPDNLVAVWAFATEGDIEARVARTEDGTEERLHSSPMPDEG